MCSTAPYVLPGPSALSSLSHVPCCRVPSWESEETVLCAASADVDGFPARGLPACGLRRLAVGMQSVCQGVPSHQLDTTHSKYKHGAITANTALLKNIIRADEEPRKEKAGLYSCCSYCNSYWDVQTCKWVCGFSENATGSDLCSSGM